MNPGAKIWDGILEVGSAVVDPSFVKLPSFASLGWILAFGVVAIFAGMARTTEHAFGRAASTTIGVALAISLLASGEATQATGGIIVSFAGMLKLIAGASLGALMGRSALLAALAVAAMAGAAWIVSNVIGSLGIDAIDMLKLLLVIACGFSTYDLLLKADHRGALPPVTILGVSVLVAGVGLIDTHRALVGSGPDSADVVVWVIERAFGIGLIGGFGATVLTRFGRRRY